jgi:hypothetical protein
MLTLRKNLMTLESYVEGIGNVVIIRVIVGAVEEVDV